MSQRLEASVLTLEGFISMSRVTVGAEILDTFGKVQVVEGVEDHAPELLYRVQTHDGLNAEFTGGHEWLMYDADYSNPRVVTTEYMMAHPEEDYVLPKPNLTTYHHRDLVPKRVFSPTALGLMLRNKTPIRAAVSVTVQDPELLPTYIPIPPDYGFAPIEDFNHYTFVWESESLAAEPSFPWLLEANLLSGNNETFEIPVEYLNSSLDVRSDLVYALTGHLREPRQPKWGSSLPHWNELDLDHPGYGEMLRYLLVSLSLHENFTRRYVALVESSEETYPTRTLKVSNDNNLYITDGFMASIGSGT